MITSALKGTMEQRKRLNFNSSHWKNITQVFSDRATTFTYFIRELVESFLFILHRSVSFFFDLIVNVSKETEG